MKNEVPYNPLDKRHLGESVADALLSRIKTPMNQIESFVGVGIYAIYYMGGFSSYKPISQEDEDEMPIYVGKKGGKLRMRSHYKTRSDGSHCRLTGTDSSFFSR